MRYQRKLQIAASVCLFFVSCFRFSAAESSTAAPPPPHRRPFLLQNKETKLKEEPVYERPHTGLNQSLEDSKQTETILNSSSLNTTSSSGLDRDEERLSRRREEIRQRSEERKAERKSRHDEIRKKYGLVPDSDHPYSRFENE